MEEHIPEKVNASKGGCDLRASLNWSRLLAGPVDPWSDRSPHHSMFAGRICDSRGDSLWRIPEGLHPMDRTHTAAICDELQPGWRICVEEVHRALSLTGRTPHWSRKEVWEGRNNSYSVWWTDCNLHSLNPCFAYGEKVDKIRSKVDSRRKGRVGEHLKIWFYFSLPLHWEETKLNFPSQVIFWSYRCKNILFSELSLI